MDQIIDFIKSLGGLATALAALFSAVGLHFLPRIEPGLGSFGSFTKRFGKWVSRRKLTLFIGAIGAGILVVHFIPDHRGPTEIMVGRAWRHFKRAETRFMESRAVDTASCNKAIFWAQQCIDQFGWKGNQQQQEAAFVKAILPKEGPANEDEKKIIFARGPLNDVSTCYFIWGRSLEYLGKSSEANKVYQAGTNLTYAMTLNAAKNGFWSPSSASLGRLTVLNSRSTATP